MIEPEARTHSASLTIDKACIQRIAKFYHLAALTCFHRQFLQIPFQSRSVQPLIKSALNLIAQMEICTSPWPLFVVICEIRTDEQRLQILQTLKQMEVHRRIRNIGVTRMIVEEFWKQRDLADRDTTKAKADWRTIVDIDKMTSPFS